MRTIETWKNDWRVTVNEACPDMSAANGKVNKLKDNEESLSELLPDIRLLYGTQPGTRTPVMYQPGIVFSFQVIKLVT
ncbi:Uncharacterised protein [Raoultella terrigena]|uniref:Uncharacterized protein n=1 Tax=Raoultella terrigena TaxID=577 RepID=A0A3P8JD01_RAOTE|nr:Uncharacterised protein [Raoultella terrigena]